jgi:DNA-binding beta-propeller fold protein YncE
LYGPDKPSRIVSPYAVAVHADGNRVAVADTNGKCVHLFDLGKRVYTRKDACGDPAQGFECPVGVAWVGDALWVADSKLHAVAIIETFGPGKLIASDRLKRPAGIAYCPTNELCYVCDAGAHAVLVFDRQGRFVMQFGSRGAGLGQFNFPSHVACGPKSPGGRAEVLVVVDSLNFRVQRISLDGKALGAFGRKGDAAGDLALPKGAAIDANGNVWVVDAHFENVQAFTPDGKLLMAFGREGQAPGEFWLPAGICIDSKGRIWVADTYNRRVQAFELMP